MLIQVFKPPPLLSFKQLVCRRDSRTLFAGIDYVISKGEIVQITGPNGIGKTTLLRAIMGLMPDYDGEIWWQGQPIDDVRYDFTRELLFIGHLTGVKKSLTPRENLLFLANLQDNSSLLEIDDALEQVGLYGYEDMLGDQLSAGQYRRVALARLYLSQASIWILDEPYTALDVQAVASLEALFVAHAQQGGCVIFTSHQAPSITALRVLALNDCQFQSQVEEGDDEI
ncbi:MAG: heme exporter protein A [Candidatus Endobugula sp.]|jgi:heme exporter protein A